MISDNGYLIMFGSGRLRAIRRYERERVVRAEAILALEDKPLNPWAPRHDHPDVRYLLELHQLMFGARDVFLMGTDLPLTGDDAVLRMFNNLTPEAQETLRVKLPE